MGNACSDVLDVIPETVILAFDVAGWTDPRGAARIAHSKTIVEAMNKELANQGQQLIAKHYAGKTVTQEDALKLLSGVGSKFTEQRQRELTQRITCAYKESPLGIWLDRNEWVLYVVVPLVVGAAGTWMYVAQVGDLPASWATSMANVKKNWKVQHLGKIDLGTQDVTFVPSKREISGKVFAMLDWEWMAIKMTLGGGMADDKFSGASVQPEVTLRVTRELEVNANTELTGLGVKPAGSSSLNLKYSGTGAGANLSLSLGGQLAYDPQGLSSFGGTASAGVKGNVGGWPTALSLSGSARQGLRPTQSAGELNLMLKLTVDW